MRPAGQLSSQVREASASARYFRSTLPRAGPATQVIEGSVPAPLLSSHRRDWDGLTRAAREYVDAIAGARASEKGAL